MQLTLSFCVLLVLTTACCKHFAKQQGCSHQLGKTVVESCSFVGVVGLRACLVRTFGLCRLFTHCTHRSSAFWSPGCRVTSRVQLWLSQDLTARIEEVEAISPRLLVTVASLPKQSRLVILVAHPPQQGNSQWTRDDFRDEFRCKELKYKCKVPDTERIFCIDATGRVGSEASDMTVQHAADQEDPNGSEFRAMLEDTDTFARTTLFSWDVT